MMAKPTERVPATIPIRKPPPAEEDDAVEVEKSRLEALLQKPPPPPTFEALFDLAKAERKKV